jgi:O-antigen/teichoic acid export membrane protein
MGRFAAVPLFFTVRIACALLLLKLTASALPVGGFAIFVQLSAFGALLNLVAIGGTQNGLIRQAAAAHDAEDLARTQVAAFLVWGAAAPLILLLAVLGRARLSVILVGNPGQAGTIILLSLLALATGPGQIWCSLLSGRKRVIGSLAAQASGLLAGTGIASWFILHGNPVAAAIGFASGSLVTMAVAWRLAAPLRIGISSPRSAAGEVRVLLRYSAAIAATTGFSSVTLFGLRSFYRDSFGATDLGYWLAANRISDMSTQFLGLYLLQIFVPQLAMADGAPAQRRLILRAGAAGAAVMAMAFIVFSIGARPLVHLFLSDAFLPAIPAIRTYMAGDFLRVWAAVAMYTAFARGRPGQYAGIEIGTYAVMAILTVVLISSGNAAAPQIGYLGAYAITLAALAVAWLSRSRSSAAPRSVAALRR